MIPIIMGVLFIFLGFALAALGPIRERHRRASCSPKAAPEEIFPARDSVNADEAADDRA